MGQIEIASHTVVCTNKQEHVFNKLVPLIRSTLPARWRAFFRPFQLFFLLDWIAQTIPIVVAISHSTTPCQSFSPSLNTSRIEFRYLLIGVRCRMAS